MITLHEDRGKRKAKTKAQNPFRDLPAAPRSDVCVRRSGYEGSLLPISLKLLYTARAHADNVCIHGRP